MVVALLVGLHFRRAARSPSIIQQPPPTVAVVAARRRDLIKSISIVAELRPWTVVNLYAKQSGYLQDIYVDYGSAVSAGETVAVLSLPEQEAAYQQADAAYKLAKVDYDRLLSVTRVEPGLVAQEDVDKAQAAYDEAKDLRDQDAVLLSYANIVAPFSGVVTKRYADPGALIQAGTASGTQPVVQVADNYVLRLVVEVPEELVERIHVGTPVDVKIQSTGQVISGRVARYSYDVHQDTRTMHTEIDVANPSLALKPGMYAQATIVLDRQSGALAVPTQAVSLTSGQPNVWIVDADNRIEERDVRIGMQTADWVQIESGIPLGARVLIGDRSALATGEKVEPKLTKPVVTV